MAAVDERLGQNDRAIGQLNEAMKSTVEPTRTNAAVHLAQLLLSTGRVDEARAVGTRLLEEGRTAALPAVAEELAKKGQRPFRVGTADGGRCGARTMRTCVFRNSWR